MHAPHSGRETHLFLQVHRVVARGAVRGQEPGHAGRLPGRDVGRIGEVHLGVGTVAHHVARGIEAREILVAHEDSVDQKHERHPVEHSDFVEPGHGTESVAIDGATELAVALGHVGVDRQPAIGRGVGDASPEFGADRVGGVGAEGGGDAAFAQCGVIVEGEGGVELCLPRLAARTVPDPGAWARRPPPIPFRRWPPPPRDRGSSGPTPDPRLAIGFRGLRAG